MQKWVLLIILIILAVLLVLYTSTSGASVKLKNESEYDISPGLLVLHADSFSMNHIGLVAPPEYESLAEIGDPSALKESIADREDVYRIIDVGHIKPGGEKSVGVGSIDEGMENVRLTYMAMIVQTNDGVVWLNSVPLSDVMYQGSNSGEADSINTYWTEILDIGTELNSPIGSGFPGGQFDPSRGEENVDNGVISGDVVDHHNQFYGDPTVSAYVLGFVRIDETEE
ncbi:MAG: spondin domain-containing protein [Candidatus Kaiserbacteria bacterium]|nr:spondin domain-containing protein [Candidatus Kaiserbacteria bacterium]